MIFHIGFQFSYLAVLGIVWAQRPVSSLYKARTKAGKHIWDIVSVSFVAQIFTAPLAILYFHQFPNYFLLTNIIVITLTPFIIGLGIAVLALSFWDFAYQYLSLALTYLIKSMNWAIVKVEAFPHSVTANIDISMLQVIFCYLLILLIFATFFYKKKSYLFQGFACIIIVMGMNLHKQIKISPQKEIVFYSTRTGYLIDCMENRTSNLFGDSVLLHDAQTYSFNIKNNHIYNRIRNVNKFENEQFVSFNGKTIFILSEPFYINPFNHKIKVDYLLLTNNKNYSIQLIKDSFDTELLLLDGSFSFYRAEQLKNACKEEKLAFHDLKNDGALCNSFTFSPKSLIQFKTETLLTPKIRPMERKPKPSKYKCNASLFWDFDLAVDLMNTV
jgi:competence protein ComEC